MSFSSSLERFYEFFLRVMCVKRGLDNATIEGVWKAVAKQSERQLGAYAFAYLLENGTAVPILQEQKIAFRNEVIHKGKIPLRDEAIAYGENVLQLISPILDQLKRNDQEYVGKAVLKHIENTRQTIAGMPHVSFMSTATTVSIARAHTEPPPNVVDSLARLDEFRRKAGW